MIWSDEQKAAFRRLMELREKRDETKALAEEAEKEYRDYERELWDKMTEDGTLDTRDASVKIPLGDPWGTISFQPKQTIYGRVLDEDVALDYLERTSQLEAFTKPKMVKARINEMVRAHLEEEKPLPEGIDWYPQRFITITRPK